MAVGTDPRPSRYKGPTVRGAVTGRERPVGGYEMWSWLFMRISGILLLVLAVGHVVIMHVLGGGVERVDFKFVKVRWDSPFWRTWDWLNGLSQRTFTNWKSTRSTPPPST